MDCFVIYSREAFEEDLQMDTIFACHLMQSPLACCTKKLEWLGIHNSLLSGFLCIWNEELHPSNTISISSTGLYFTSGVPQRAKLGPCRYRFTWTRLSFYWFETLFIFIITSLEDETQLLQKKYLGYLRECSIKNSLDLNIKKCSTITFTGEKNPHLASYTLWGTLVCSWTKDTSSKSTLMKSSRRRNNVVGLCLGIARTSRIPMAWNSYTTASIIWNLLKVVK